MSLRHALLGLLVERTASGYDLMKLFNTSLANVWPATQSQVYGELGRLADAGLIDVAAEGPRGRKDYALTASGLAELRSWVAASGPDHPLRSELLLRVFFLDVVPRQQALDYLDDRAARAAEQRRQLGELEDSLDWRDGMLSSNGRLALEYGLRLSAMEEEWARWARDRIAARPAAAPAPSPPATPASPAATAPTAPAGPAAPAATAPTAPAPAAASRARKR
jgi:DNA-binding PadR family transcriptional regulator